MIPKSFALSCTGCGAEIPVTEPLPFACPNRDKGPDDKDHVLGFSVPPCEAPPVLRDGENPFVALRKQLWIWHAAQARGQSDDDYLAAVAAIDRGLVRVTGSTLRVTPYRHYAAYHFYGKSEVSSIAGSHKSRHLIGLAIHLELIERAGLAPWTRSPMLAIASCGNAALAAATVARAVNRALTVFVPDWANPLLVRRLRTLDANIRVCARVPGSPPGDPCYWQFREAVASGALPFTCQGPDNGLTIDGGKTLGLELAGQHHALKAPPLTDLWIQVGGGALASSVFLALADLQQSGALATIRCHSVQTLETHPLHRAWKLLAKSSVVDSERLDYALHHRSEFMWPWTGKPQSIATGILDDETYDWFQVVRGLARTGGQSWLVSEQTLARARDLAAALGEPVSATGAAGLAGLLRARQELGAVVKTPAVVFSGQHP